jgi:hypothetical protein
VDRLELDRLELVELIEAQKSKLSPQARGLWDEFDALINRSNDARKPFIRQEHDVMRRIGKLPGSDKRILNPLRELRVGLYESDDAESRGEPGESYRVDSVLRAARFKDRDLGRAVEGHMTLEQAVTRLKEDDSPA